MLLFVSISVLPRTSFIWVGQLQIPRYARRAKRTPPNRWNAQRESRACRKISLPSSKITSLSVWSRIWFLQGLMSLYMYLRSYRTATLCFDEIFDHQWFLLPALGRRSCIVCGRWLVKVLLSHVEWCRSLKLMFRQPVLSPEQQSHRAVWRRQDPLKVQKESSSSLSLLPSEIIQHIVSDCSVCGGISVCVDHHRRFGSKVCDPVQSISSMHFIAQRLCR